MKEKIKSLLTILASILLVLLLLSTFARPWYYRLLYWGDRITGTVELFVDGEKAPFEVGFFSTRNELIPGRARTRSDGSVKVRIHAGDYGPYGFDITSEALPDPITVVSYQYNWWNVCRFRLRIDVDTAAGTVHCVSEAKTLNEAGFFRPESYDELYELADGPIRFAVVWI